MSINNPGVNAYAPMVGQIFQTIAGLEGINPLSDGSGYAWVNFDGSTIALTGNATLTGSMYYLLFQMLYSNPTVIVTPARSNNGVLADWKAGYKMTLPDFRGRTFVTAGQGSGLTNRVRLALFGAETVALQAAENGPHSHAVPGNILMYDGNAPVSANIQMTASPSLKQYVNSRPTSDTVSSGSGQPHNNMQPSVAVLTYICTGRKPYTEYND